MCQIYRIEYGQKVIVGFADSTQQAAVIMEAEREKIDSEMQLGMEKVQEEQDGISDQQGLD